MEDEPYGDMWRVLMADGQFAKRPVWYFEPDRDRAQLSFGLTADVPFAEVRDHLIKLARQQPGATLLVSQVFPDEEDEAIEHEIIHFFAKEYGGAVWCSDVRAEPEGISIVVAHDRDMRTANLDQLIEFCRSRALILS